MARRFLKFAKSLFVRFSQYFRKWLTLVALSLCGTILLWALVLTLVFSIIFFDGRVVGIVIAGVGTFITALLTFIFQNLMGLLLFAVISLTRLSSNQPLRLAIALLTILGLLAKLVIDAASNAPWLQSSNQLLAFLIWVIVSSVTSEFVRRFEK